MLTRTLQVFAITCVLGLSPYALAQDQNANPIEQFPKVVAVVNGQTITREKLGQDCLLRYGTIVLDNLLNKRLILQACSAQGITITQADVNEEIDRVANKVGLNSKLFLEALEKERDIQPEQYASEIIWPILALRALAADKIQVTDTEVEKVLQNEYGPKVQVRMIAVSQGDKAQELHASATASPEMFRRLAKEHSEDAPSASVEGLLPPIRQHSGDQLERIAFQLKPNEISPIFQVGNMHVFLQCVRHLEAGFPSAQMLPAIRGRIEEQLRDQRLGAAADEIFATLQQNSQVVTVLGNPDLERQYPGVAGFINRQPVLLDHLAAECIARHGKEILRGEISRFLLTTALNNAQKTVAQADVDAEVARAADMAGYIDRESGLPDIDAWLKSIVEEEGVTIELYVSDAVWPSVALKKLVEDQVVVTDEDLSKGFASNFGPRAEVLAIVLTNQRTAQDVFRQARDNLTEQAFGELAAKFSVEPVSRSNFGKIPPIRRFSGQPTLEDAAFALGPGEISGVLAWGEQYAILYKQGETKPIVQDFAAVSDELNKEIYEKKMRVAMRKHMDSLLKSAQIDNFLDNTTQSGVVPASGRAPAK